LKQCQTVTKSSPLSQNQALCHSYASLDSSGSQSVSESVIRNNFQKKSVATFKSVSGQSENLFGFIFTCPIV